MLPFLILKGTLDRPMAFPKWAKTGSGIEKTPYLVNLTKLYILTFFYSAV